MVICQWVCLNNSGSPYSSLTSDLYLLYVMSPCSWFVLNVLYCWIFKTKTLTQCVGYLSEYKLSWFCSQYFPLLYDDPHCSKFLILKTSRENSHKTIPLHFIFFISCNSYLNSMMQGLLSPVHRWKKGVFENLCNLP